VIVGSRRSGASRATRGSGEPAHGRLPPDRCRDVPAARADDEPARVRRPLGLIGLIDDAAIGIGTPVAS